MAYQIRIETETRTIDVGIVRTLEEAKQWAKSLAKSGYYFSIPLGCASVHENAAGFREVGTYFYMGGK